MIDRLRIDVVSVLRGLRAAPGPAAAAIITLAVAIGMNLAIFGVIDRAILSPPAHVADPGRVFTLAFEHTLPDGQHVVMATTSYVTFDAVRTSLSAGSTAAAWRPSSTSTIVEREQIQAETVLVSGSYFPMLGAQTQFGRAILEDDDRAPAGAAVAVLSHTFWRSAFGGDVRVLGRRLVIRGTEFEVIGVMPAGFSGHSATRADVWVPLHAAMRDSPGWDRQPYQRIVEIGVRIGPGENVAATSTQASTATGHRVILSPISGARVAPSEHAIAYWLGAVSALVLVIGLANAATLLIVQAARRRRESSIRVALGATRGRLLSQMVVEAAILASIAVVAALLLAWWLDEAIRRVLLPSLIESTGTSARTIGLALLAGLVTLVVAVAVGAAQFPSPMRADIVMRTRGSRRATALLVVQTALAVVLLAGAGLFGRSLHALVSQDFGMRMNDVLLVEFERGAGRIPDRDELFSSALEHIRALPGVALATKVGILPFTGFQVPPISVPGLAEPPNVDGQLPFLIAATPELFDVLGLEIVRGRRFTAADETGRPVAIVNETMARGVWPGGDAIGKCFRIGFDPNFDPETAVGPPTPPLAAPCREIVGIVRDVRQRSVIPTGNETRLMQYYVPFSQNIGLPPAAGATPHIQGLLLRTTVGAEALAAPIRRILVDGRTDLPFVQVRPYAELLYPQMRPWRMGTMLLMLFSGLALIVAAIGLYAAFAQSLGERRHEMAVRIAIGALPRGVLMMVLREAATLAGAGAAAGALLTALAGRWTHSMLFGTSAADPLVLASASALMVLVAAMSTLVPARRASQADPGALLRAE